MGLFEKAGRTFEETKRAFVGGNDYVCRSCEEAVARDYDHCPHCGAESVEPIS